MEKDDRFGNIVPRVFTPVLAKHSKSFSLIDGISVGFFERDAYTFFQP